MNASVQHVAVLVNPLTTRIEQAAVPEPRTGEVRVRLQGCGVCASNIAVWEGRPWFEYPRAAGSPGHEGWGVVDAVGASVEDMEVGERVALISGHAYAEFDIAPRESLVRLPQAFDELPFPGEPLGCVMNIFERAQIEAHHRVAVVGAGFLGLLLTQLAARAGAQVVVISRRHYALELAAKMGAVATVSTAERENPRDRAWTLSDGRGYDRVIEAVGTQESLDLASAIAAEYGRLVIAGYHQDGPRQVDMQQWNWRALDVVNAHERSTARYVAGVQRAVAAILDGRLEPFPLFTHCLPLARLDDAFEMTRSRPNGFMKAVVTTGGQA
jgi:threonine dehydrogenase-like Zn-dependent dehydrogenase